MSNRSIINFNNDWHFSKLSGTAFSDVNPSDIKSAEWENVTLPHTWNKDDCCGAWADGISTDSSFFQGMGVYKKSFLLQSEEFSNRLIFVEFEAANTVAEVFVNGVNCCRHEGGYSAFRADITKYVRLDAENQIVVFVDNSPTDFIAPIQNQGDFTKMGGLYRDVKLIAVSKTHIDLCDFGASGVYITPKNICNDRCDVDICVKLKNDSDSAENVTVSAEIIDADSNIIAQGVCKKQIGGNEAYDVTLLLNLCGITLWQGVKNPYLYTAEITIEGSEGVLDSFNETFGIRSFAIDPDNGFYLNGVHTVLHGVNYHQDSFEHGWAMTDSERRRDYQMMLDMGVNSVRMAHYQHSSHELDICDRLGITAWCEIGIVNKMSPDDSDRHSLSGKFKDNAKTQLTELIRQNYNHPSIIVWGITNELYQMTDEIFDFYCELNRLAKDEDKTRLTTFADSQFWGRFKTDMPTDVLGCNRYFGWYKDAGPAEKFGEWLDMYHEGVKQAICVSEYGGGGAASMHKDNIVWEDEIDPWGLRHYENYQSAMHEVIWSQFAERRYLWGNYVWCMFDFPSNGRREGDTIGQNDKGLVTRNRIPKDAYYFYKSVWNPEPMIYITEKRHNKRSRFVPAIKVYSNAESVTLIVNGAVYGSVRSDELEDKTVFEWKDVELLNGLNRIEAVASFEDLGEIRDCAEWECE